MSAGQPADIGSLASAPAEAVWRETRVARCPSTLRAPGQSSPAESNGLVIPSAARARSGRV